MQLVEQRHQVGVGRHGVAQLRECGGLRSDRAAMAIGAKDAALILDKRLPVASGIGGGSADAADHCAHDDENASNLRVARFE